MMPDRVCASWLVMLAGVVMSGCASVSPVTKSADAPDPGYFLSCRQKWQLVSRGTMEDSYKNLYDVWLIPGYVDPARKAGENAIDAADCLADYIRADTYLSLADKSVDAFDWAFNDCIVDLAIKGTGYGWRDALDHAGEVTERRAFGWWLAYPWALTRETVCTAVRVPLGLTGAALGTVCGAVAVPGYFLARPAVASTFIFSFGAVARPAVLSAWNTAVAPPAAMLGQKPSPSRVDGYWVKVQLMRPLGDQPLQPALVEYNKDVQALIRWGQRGLEVTRPFGPRGTDLRAKAEEEKTATQKRLNTALAELNQEQERAISALASEPDMCEVLQHLRVHGYNQGKLNDMSRDFSEQMKLVGMTNGPSSGDLLEYLRQHSPTNYWDNPPPGGGPAPKTP